MTTVAVFGASRGVGRAVVARALAAGLSVRVLVRASHALAAHDRLHVVVGDVLRDGDVREVLAGADTVVCALGAPASSEVLVRAEGTAAIVRVMKDSGLRRIVAVSVFGAAESRSALPPFVRWVYFPLLLSRVLADHEAQERVLAESSLDWCIVRAPALVDAPARDADVVVDFEELAGLEMKVSRDELAAFVLREAVEGSRIQRATPIARRPRAVSAPRVALASAVPGALVSAAMSAAVAAYVVPVPSSILESAVASGASGLVSALLSTTIGVLSALRSIPRARSGAALEPRPLDARVTSPAGAR